MYHKVSVHLLDRHGQLNRSYYLSHPESLWWWQERKGLLLQRGPNPPQRLKNASDSPGAQDLAAPTSLLTLHSEPATWKLGLGHSSNIHTMKSANSANRV